MEPVKQSSIAEPTVKYHYPSKELNLKGFNTMHMLSLTSSHGPVHFPIYTDAEVIVSKIEKTPGDCEILHSTVSVHDSCFSSLKC